MTAFFKRLSNKDRERLARDFQQIAEHDDVVDCALLDREGRIVHSLPTPEGVGREFDSGCDQIRRICDVADLYLDPESAFENVHLYCATGEIIIWDFGQLFFVVIGKNIMNIAYLRMRANILKNDVALCNRTQKYSDGPEDKQLHPDGEAAPLYAILTKEEAENGEK